MNFGELAQAIQLALKSIQMYSDVHPKTQESLNSLFNMFNNMLSSQPTLHIAASNGKLFFDSKPLEANTVHTNALVRQLSERQISGFIIQTGVTQEEILTTLKILTYKPAKIKEMGGVAKIMEDNHIIHIALGRTRYKEISATGGDGNGSSGGSGDGIGIGTGGEEEAVQVQGQGLDLDLDLVVEMAVKVEQESEVILEEEALKAEDWVMTAKVEQEVELGLAAVVGMWKKPVGKKVALKLFMLARIYKTQLTTFHFLQW